MSNGSSTPPVNPHESVWAEWTKGLRWKSDLERRATHKALDIPEDPMIQANRISGVTWKEIAAGGAVLAGILGAGKYLFDPPKADPPAATSTVDTDTDTLTALEFVEPAK